MAQFPKEFIWGTACASFQCEGAWNEDGKGPNIWDDFCHLGGHVKNDDTGDTACDSYHRVEEDVDLICMLNTKAHRFSISWPRLFPDGTGSLNEKGFAYYDRLVDALLENGIEPWITLYHWDLPSALQREGGWMNRKTVEAFARYAECVGKHFDGRVRHYMPVNEPQCISYLGYGKGEHAPGWKIDPPAMAQVIHNLTLAHATAARELRCASANPLEIGTVTCGRMCYPEMPSEEEAAYRATFDLSGDSMFAWAFTHNVYLDPIFGKPCDDSAPEFLKRFCDSVPASDRELYDKPDFLGLNIYNGECVDADGRPAKLPAGFPRTAMGWPVTPEIMYYAPRHLMKRYGLPVVITENGLACDDPVCRDGKVHDAERIDFLARYLTELNRAMDSGVDVRGYFQWSILDNFEWAKGYDKRFGLVHVDFQTYQRTPKDSFDWYAETARTGVIR